MPILLNKFKQFPRLFWVANFAQVLDRWAWYGLFMVFALYLTGSRETGALGLTQVQKGNIMGISGVLLYVLPVIIGALADRTGFKKLFLISTFILSIGYFLIGYFTTYTGVFFIFTIIAIGSSISKPLVSATISRTTNKSNSSLGFGIYYTLLNLGILIGPVCASKIREDGYIYVFYASAIVIVISFIQLLILYKEPIIEKLEEKNIFKTLSEVFLNIFKLLKNPKIIILIIFVALYSAAYNQISYSLPVYIDQWSDTSLLFNKISSVFPSFASALGTSNHRIDAVMIVSMNALYIVLLQVPLSYTIKKINTFSSMIFGFFISSIGIAITFMTCNPIIPIFSILLFSIGQMTAVPKLLAYIKEISPKDKTAMYMGGLFFLPLAIGSWIGGILAGNVYQTMSDKITLLRNFLTTKNITLPAITEHYTKNDFIAQACQTLKLSNQQLNNTLWNTYHPNNIWIVYSGICLLAGLGLLIFRKYITRLI